MKKVINFIIENCHKMYLIILICVIMTNIINTYAEDFISSRKVKYAGQELECFTDFIKFHTQTNGYEVMLNQELPNNFYAYRDMDIESGSSKVPMNVSETYKTKGYGNYVFKEDTNLFSFVEWCHTINAGITEASSYRAGETPEKEWSYQKLIGYKGLKMSKEAINHMNYFWQNMSTLLGETFKEYQDSYYFEKFVLKGMNKAGMTVAKIRNVQKAHKNGDEEVSGIEYMTLITSYMFAILSQANENFTIGKGDVVPFLYYSYKTKEIYNIEETNPKELARYAYIPLIEGWCTSAVGTNLWLQEYRQLFGEYNPDELSETLETLNEWYDEIYDKYKNDKGRKGNNLLGCDITTIIQSDYSVSDQLEATSTYLDNMFNELGLERSYKENIARNQMMAEYMMQDSGLDETIKDYNVSIKFTTENLQRGTFEPKNSHTAVLSDYQTIKLNHTLEIDGNSDQDTISDLQELGNIKWMDITSFVEKTYNDMKSKGEPCKSSLIEQIEDIVNKQGGNYLEKRWGHVKVEGTGDDMRVYYRTYDYTSNPILDDTDFDGIRDDQDNKKLNGTFRGTSDDIGKIKYNNDFRWFFTKNTKYNDELAAMSLIASNLANSKTISTDQVSGNITQYLENLGFVDVRCISNNGSVYMGKKTITYYGVTKNIYAVILGGGETESNYKAILDYVNDDDKQTIKTVYVNNIKRTMQDVATEIANNVYFNTNGNTFWVTGYGVAGSIASEVGAKLTDKGAEVFCYTFGATNTGVGTKGTYINIKNVINEDDYIPKVANPNVYQRPGQIYSSSIKEDLMYEYREIVGNTNYKGDYYLSNYIGKVYNESLTGMSYEILNQLLNEWSRHLAYYESLSQNLETNDETSDVALAINRMKEGNKDAHSMKSYYVLAKSLNGFDLTDGNGEKIEKYKFIPLSVVQGLSGTQSEETHIDVVKDLLTCIEEMGVWYVNHIATYNNKLYGSNKNYYDKASESAKNHFGEYANFTLPITATNSTFTLKTNQDEIIEGSSDILLYKHDELFDIEKDLTMTNNGYVGDGCNLFVTAVIRLFKEGRVGSITGVTAKGMRKDNATFDNAMYDLGFKKYQLYNNKDNLTDDKNNKWFCMSKDNPGGIEVKMSLEKLKPGDMLLRNPKNFCHIEFYLGNKYDSNNIESRTLNDVIQPITINGQTFQGKEGTFSWGSTHNTFPVNISGVTNQYFYFTFNEANNNMFRLRYSKWSLSYDTNGDYDTIWRYEP